MEIYTSAMGVVGRGWTRVVVIAMVGGRVGSIGVVVAMPAVTGRVVMAVVVAGGKADNRRNRKQEDSQGTKVHIGCIMGTWMFGVKVSSVGFSAGLCCHQKSAPARARCRRVDDKLSYEWLEFFSRIFLLHLFPSLFECLLV